MLGRVYGNDAEARERSTPIMDELHSWLERQLPERETEPNSGWAMPLLTCGGTSGP